jgi:molybdenum cofactor cytidylyltransferase
MDAAAVVPAAGRGERFGTPLKQLADVEGVPMLERTIRSLLDAGVNRVIVVTAAGAQMDRVAVFGDRRVTRAINPAPERGMFSSIQAGIAAAEGDPILVLPGDMPFVARDTVAALVAAAPLASVTMPRYRGKRGHPVALPARLREAILAASATTNLSHLIDAAGEERLYIDVDDPGILRDVDTPQDLSPLS